MTESLPTDMTAADLALLTTAMPCDTNPAGDIFGGWLMAQMDLGAGNVAQRRAHGRCATVAVDSFHFLTPVKVGDEVSVYARIIREGRTSLTLKVEAFRRARPGPRHAVAVRPAGHLRPAGENRGHRGVSATGQGPLCAG